MNQQGSALTSDLNTLISDNNEPIKYWRVYGATGTLPPGIGAENDLFITARRVNDAEWGRQTVEDVRSDKTFKRWFRPAADGNITFGAWVENATATPPQEYNLLLAAGVTGTAKYCVDQIGYVHIRGWVGGVDAVASVTPLIATLPAGYRPAISCEAILPVSSADNTLMAYRLKIFDTGEMRVLSATDRSRVTKGISIDIDFRAA